MPQFSLHVLGTVSAASADTHRLVLQRNGQTGCANPLRHHRGPRGAGKAHATCADEVDIPDNVERARQ